MTSACKQGWMVLLGVAAGASGASAQNALWELSAAQVEGFGATVIVIGDVNADGVADVAVGAPGVDKVRVRSGVDGSFLYVSGGKAGSEYGSVLEALGDVDGDGVPDYGVGAPLAMAYGDDPEGGEFYVHSGVDGSVLDSHRGTKENQRVGNAALGVGDLSGDGFVDYMFREHAQGVDRLRIHNGATGFVQWTLAEYQADSDFGVALAGGADLDEDGVPDFVVGAPRAKPFGSLTAFSGSIWSGVAPLFHHTFVQTETTGMTLALPGDLDGDGLCDVAVGLPFQDDGLPETLGLGVVRTFGAHGLALAEIAGLPTVFEEFGSSLAALGDVDGDGFGDLAVGARYPFGRATALSAVDGRRLYSTLGGGVGGDVAGGADFDGDGVPDLVTSGVGFGVSDGLLRTVSSRQGALLELGESCAAGGGLGPRLHVLGTASPSGQLAIFGWAAQPTQGVLVLGMPSAPIPLSGGCSVHVAPVVTMVPWFFTAQGVPVGGIGDTLLDLPADALGLDVAMQLFVGGPQGLSASNGVSVHVLD